MNDKEVLQKQIEDAKWDITFYKNQIEKSHQELEIRETWLASLEKKLAELN